MQLTFDRHDEFIRIDKPFGISTHSPDHGKIGIKEIFESYLNKPLYNAHRLDKTTTGNLILPTSKEFATLLSEQFAKHQVKKVYRFVTDRISKDSEYTQTTPIDGKDAETHFLRIKRTPFFELWEARPTTGRAHQIRIHAREIGLAILGDTTYSGTTFPHLCLHNLSLEFSDKNKNKISFTSPQPIFFDRLGVLRDPILIRWLAETDRRQRMYNFLKAPHQCIRLLHDSNLRIDLLGEQLWFYWYSPEFPTRHDRERIECFSRFLRKKFFLKIMHDRGTTPDSRDIFHSMSWKENWISEENEIRFNFSSDLGQSPGLFLDQANNRQWVKNFSKDKKVLNLFSYTCGFSVAAALGQAKEVISVDVSKKFLDYGKANFLANNLDPELFSFFAMDVIKFIKSAQKNQRRYDLIICDPPSFGRSKDTVFKIEKEIDFLFSGLWELLNPNGALLFSTNYEKWSEKKIREIFGRQIRSKDSVFLEVPPRWDYELPQEERLMKYFVVTKK